MINTNDDSKDINGIKDKLLALIDMKDHNTFHYFLGIHVDSSPNDYIIL